MNERLTVAFIIGGSIILAAGIGGAAVGGRYRVEMIREGLVRYDRFTGRTEVCGYGTCVIVDWKPAKPKSAEPQPPKAQSSSDGWVVDSVEPIKPPVAAPQGTPQKK